MIWTIYYIILAYFLFGGIGFYVINRRKDPRIAQKSYTKFITYFFIINILFFSIIIKPVVFRYLSVFIICAGFFELLKLFCADGYSQKRFFTLSMGVFIVLSAGFFFFSGFRKELILFSFLILSIFDSFSQITGQLWGHIKITPEISPNKTLGGLIGGALVAIASALLLNGLYAGSILKLLLTAVGIIIFAFAGDIAASFYKRKYKVKDFSNFIPGHGGFLDRFDSLIAGGAWVALSAHVLNF
jgi:phosphatidate cytidylyltransferase